MLYFVKEINKFNKRGPKSQGSGNLIKLPINPPIIPIMIAT